MYPTLYHLVRAVFGVRIPPLAYANTYGAVVLLAFWVANRVFAYECARAERSGLLVMRPVRQSSAQPIMNDLARIGLCALVGWKGGVVLRGDASSSVARVGDLTGSAGSGIGLTLGVLVGVGVVVVGRRRSVRTMKPSASEVTVDNRADQSGRMRQWRAHAWNATSVAAIWGFIGAKLLFLIEHPGEFRAAGFTMFGGLLLAGAMVMRYFHRNELAFWPAVDAASLGVYAAYGVGRLACHFSGDGDWGVVNTRTPPAWIPNWIWAYDYPNNVIRAGGTATTSGGSRGGANCFPGYCTRLAHGVFPTSIYEFVLAALGVLMLVVFRKRIATPGVRHGLFLAMIGAQRIAIDPIRDHEPWLGGYSQVAVISVLMIVGGLGLVVIRKRQVGVGTAGERRRSRGTLRVRRGTPSRSGTA